LLFSATRDYTAAAMKTFSAGLLVLLLSSAPSDGQTVGGEWQSLASMPSDRQELASAALNGKIYVIGGLDPDGFPTDTVDVYNPATNSWASAAPNPTVVDHNNAAVAAGKLYSFGGGRIEPTFTIQ
jgi:N-acetylneuraminic acid mutarotase